jgi:hypothetical protein
MHVLILFQRKPNKRHAMQDEELEFKVVRTNGHDEVWPAPST